MANYDDTACRWVEVEAGYTDKNYLKNDRMPVSRGRIFSYGSHFIIAEMLRDEHNEPSFLINGDRFSNTTTKHQAAVLGAITRRASGIPRVTIPFSALDVAGIIHSSVRIVQSTSDWFEERHESRFEMPAEAKWEYTTRIEDRGGWRNSLTHEFVPRPEGSHYGGMPKSGTCVVCKDEPGYHHFMKRYPEDRERGWAEFQEVHQGFEAHRRLRHGVWEEVSHTTKNTGRKVVRNKRGWVEWDIEDDPDSPTGIAFVRTWQRHWLGASLIRAQVQYRGRQRCTTCQHTGEVDPYIVELWEKTAEGPLTEGASRRADDYAERWPDDPEPRRVKGSFTSTTCRTCGGSRWTAVNRRRWAYFLSAFDQNEARPSYFFCELPPKVKPTTVNEALEMLKPGSVRLAEELGREVERQGDIFWIPMPELDTRDLKNQGRYTRRKVESEIVRWGGNQKTFEGDPFVLSTNHTVTEQVRVGRLTYGRGVLRHEPDRRRPDHARIRLGDGKTWGLIVKNTVPVG